MYNISIWTASAIYFYLSRN